MTKFAPGPWKVCITKKAQKSGLRPGIDTAQERFGFTIVAAEHKNSEGIFGRTPDEAMANAALIAAAPEMYAALENIVVMTDADDDDSYRSDDREGCLDTVYAVAKAALRKADGLVKHNRTEEE